VETYERIHRSNLVGMGVLPLQYREGESATTLGLSGHEVFDVTGLSDAIRPRSEVTVTAVATDGTKKTFQVVARLDSAVEVNYYRNGGILPTVLRSLLKST
jgi:aconitate hydratase